MIIYESKTHFGTQIELKYVKLYYRGCITWILELQKTGLRKIRISGTVGGPLLMQKSPTCAYIGQNRGSRGPR